jgi:hypothetical protein
MPQTNYDATTAERFQVDADQNGPAIKNESGVLGVRDDADSAYVKMRVADPTGDDDVATKRYGDANWGSGAGSDVQALVFVAAGPYRVDTQVDGRHYNRTGRTLTIDDVTLFRETAGTGGSTTIDINVDGTSIYSVTPANRPSITAASGDNQISQGGAPDTTTIANNSYVTLDIDAIETGARENLRVVVTAS